MSATPSTSDPAGARPPGAGDGSPVAGPPGDPAGARRSRLEAAFAREEFEALVIGARLRVVGAVVIGSWLLAENPFPEVLYLQGLVVLFAVLGAVHVALRRRGRGGPWLSYLFPTLDVALVVMATLVPNPFEHEIFPIQMELRFGNETYLFVVVATSVFSFSPRVVLWTGAAAAIAWSIGTAVILALPDSLGWLPHAEIMAMSDTERIAAVVDPRRIWLGPWGRQVLLLLVQSILLATLVWRARTLVDRQTEAERQRANLSRYFSANVVDDLARSDEALGATRQQDVAVLFADMVGFTELSERLPTAEVIALLRDLHARLEEAVFAHAGTLEKFLGDGIMATFGTPRTSATDASNALACGRRIVAAVAAWNDERARRGAAPVRVGVGVHYGPVVLGDVGGEQRLEFAVVGDTVNVASRLERLTRALAVPLVVSDALVDAVRRETRGGEEALAGLVPAPPQNLRGRRGEVAVWQLAG